MKIQEFIEKLQKEVATWSQETMMKHLKRLCFSLIILTCPVVISVCVPWGLIVTLPIAVTIIVTVILTYRAGWTL